MTKRIVSRRDSATTILRKMGINSRDYDVFIKNIDGQFEVNVALAESHLIGLKQQAAVSKVPTKKIVKVPSTKEPVATSSEIQKVSEKVVPASKKTIASPFPIESLTKGAIAVDTKSGSASMPKTKSNGAVKIAYAGESMSEFSRKLILAGHSNAEVWVAIKDQFNMDYEKQRGYPAWYRHKLRKQGHPV
jgi:hypothetical protein